MKKTLLDNSIYSRWIQTGTLHGVTHHSMCCITNTNVELSVIFPFLTQYVQIAILALAQRSAILLLSTEAAVVANGFSDDEYITPEQIVEIEALQAKYVKVQNQLLLSEITVQEQGIEIYEMFRQQLYIHQNKQERQNGKRWTILGSAAQKEMNITFEDVLKLRYARYKGFIENIAKMIDSENIYY